MSKTYMMNGLMEKMTSPDQDFRFMALNDLMTQVKAEPASLTGDESTERKVLQHVLKLVQDKISEVKNQAVKCLGQLIKIIRETQMDYVVDSLIEFSGSQHEELRDIAGLALKTVTSEIPQDGNLAAKACAKLTPKLLLQLQNSSTPPETLIETLSILSILITRFPAHLSNISLQPQPVQVITPLLNHPRPAVRKRAIVTLAQYLPTSPPVITSNLLKSFVIAFLAPSAPLGSQRTTIQLIAAIARFSPQIVSPLLGELVPGILKGTSRDDDELRESSLQALETLVLRCPAEITPYLSQIISVGVILIKHDPNYAGDDEDEDAQMGDDDEDDDAELDDEYSDDEDTSYKIRRSATKLLASVIATRPELLGTLYKSVSPVLISRFGDREESVRLEVWATYSILLSQTGVYGGQARESDSLSIGGKRKREEEEGEMDVEETPYSILRSQVSSLAKGLLKQLQSVKTPPATLQAGFTLLHGLLTVLPGCLANQATVIMSTTKFVLSQSPTTTTSALHVTVLSFLATFFATHPSTTFAGVLSSLTPSLLSEMRERHPRVAAETFAVFSSLLSALGPVKFEDWVDPIYDEAVHRLKSNDTDAQVRERAGELIGDLWISAAELVRNKGGQEWQALLRPGGRTEGPVKVVRRVASEAETDDQWINGCVDWVSNVLKKSGRAGKVEAFTTLNILISKYKAGVPANLATHLIPQLKVYLTITDIALFSQSLTTLTLLLQLSAELTFPEVENTILQDIYPLAHSPLVSGASLDALLGFFGALVEADSQIASHVVPGLMISMNKANRSETVPGNVAKVVSRVVRSQTAVAAGMIAEFSKSLRPGSKANESQVVLSLLTLGEIGRFIDMSLQPDVFNTSLSLFTADSEDIRTAAAFAAGNMTIGNVPHFLPAILSLARSSNDKKILALHALKEVVSNCSVHQLESVADALWVPLFERSENAEEATRNVAAACLGKLTTTNPSKYLPQLQARLRDPTPSVRATVVSAIRYTFADTARSYDELLAPLIVEFLSLVVDEDLTVRRLSLSALNAAARNKPHLIRDHLGAILPHLYAETVVNQNLIRIVQMGPWQHKVDDGLEARKTAYETMYTLLDTCLNRIDVHEFFGRVLAGLADEADEVKVLCHMMLFRLSQVATTAVAQRLDEATPELEKTMRGAAVTKDTVKQDLERTAELQRSALRAIAALSKINSPGVAPKFEACVESMRRSPTWGAEFQELVGKA